MIAETSCVVRSVHEELLGAYLDVAAARPSGSAALNELLCKLDDQSGEKAC